jgi:pyruvate dehydrogenase E2 component (dihydrolipoamide acetyltransferase)
MTDTRIKPIVMPKWGLSMKEGKVTGWLLEDGSTINPGDAILEVETDKIAGSVEASEAGVLRRRVGQPDTVYPVKTLLGVIADASVPETEIDAFVAAYVVPAGEEGEEEQGPKYEFVDTGAGRLRFVKRGTGSEILILIHGFGGDLDGWLFNLDPLAEVATVYALDLPGHGQSTKKLDNPSLNSLVASVWEFMASLGIQSAHVVGHSMGGAIGLRMATQHPEKIRTLTLICSAGLGQEIGSYVDEFVAAQSRKDLKPVLEKLFADKNLVSRQLVDDVLKYKRLDGVSDLLKELSVALFAGRRQQDMPAAELGGQVPRTLIIWGKDDQIIPVAHAVNLPGAKVHVIEGAGHMVYMEKSSEINGLIRGHIASTNP